jgi:hypothetical protein
MGERQLDRRLLALVAARFQSPFDGERLAALEAFGRILTADGATWSDLIGEPGKPAAAADTVEGRPGPPNHLEIITALARDGVDVITPWERSFLAGCAERGRLSAKQWKLLSQIVGKVDAVRACHGTGA